MFDAQLCETVDAGGGDSLLRVAGRWSPGAPDGSVLVRFGAGAIERIEPLPPGPATGPDGLWRAAFQVAEVQATGTDFALMTSDNVAVALPRPTRRGSTAPAPAKPPEPDADERLRRAEEDLADANALADQLRRRCALAERGLAEFRDKLVSAWGEAASMRDLLDEREAAHNAAKERARAADAVVAEIEARAERSREELAARRDELQDHIARLQGELVQRVASERSAVEQLAATDQLRADAADALARFESARAESDDLKAQLDEARVHADAAAGATARAAREILDERMRAENAVQEADVYSERLAKAERELREAREELAQVQAAAVEATELSTALTAEKARADEATQRVEDAERELATAREEMAAVAAHVETLEGNVARAEEGASEELAAERTRAAEAADRAAAAERELAAAREQVVASEEAADRNGEQLAEAERELHEARDELARVQTAAADTEELVEALAAEKARADDAVRRIEDAERSLREAREELAAAAARVAMLEADAAHGSADELTAERARAEEAAGRAAAAETALAAAREQLANEQSRADEAARRAGESEWQLAEAQRRLAAGEARHDVPAPTPAQAAVEADLRHLLERRERELDDARAELAEQRERYAAVASEVPPIEEPSTPPKAEPWSRVDEDLLERLARAKSLAGQE